MNETVTYHALNVGTGHCSAAIIEEITRVKGVERVEVDPRSGLVGVAGRDVNATAVVAAIYAAGYEAVIA